MPFISTSSISTSSISTIKAGPRPVEPVSGLPGRLTFLFAVSVAIAVLGLFASQSLIGLIGPAFDFSAGEAGFVTTLTLLGYASGLFLLVPLADIVENRSLIVATLAVEAVALAAVACAPTPALFLTACYVCGLAASAIQMLVPAAAQLSSPAHRGRVVGNVMSGLMIGILLSRPAASLVAEIADWRWFYGGLAVLVAILAAILVFVIPRRQPAGAVSYMQLIGSLWTILRQEPVLRRRAAYQALCMGAFGVFWTSVALRLAQAPFGLGQIGIALFAFAGAAGAVVAPLAGRAGDKGRTRGATLLAHLAVIGAMAMAEIGGDILVRGASPGACHGALATLVAAAILLDLGVVGDQTLGRRAVNLLRPEARGRINGLFTGLFFIGTSTGAGLSGFAWVYAGWPGICAVGAAFGVAALITFVTEKAGGGASRG